ncbi:hypothetical protein [Roseburia intestinalis]|uniref:hypothetical protein n=1 Tax=Roseburia intestinalis TaxID=166486 RepID=UPI00189B0447|nr:hypothetical protein [Roseburia intestinalis]
MNIKMMNEIKSQGHPCSGCPYVFTRGGTDCIMGAVPGDCAWYFYKWLMGHTDAAIPSEEIRKQYREYVKRQSKAEEKLERGIDMLLEVAELKYGRQYAQSLKKKMRGGTD